MRNQLDRALVLTTGLCGVVVFGFLLAVIVAIAYRGLPALATSLATPLPELQTGGDRLVFQVIGTGILVATAIAICAPLSVALALVHTEYTVRPSWRRLQRVFLQTANAVPSVLFGIFGFLVFVKALGWGKSWLAGGILLGWMILPTATLAVVERLEALPRKYPQGAYALGLTRGQVVRGVLLPHAWPGLLSGLMLGVARAAGETAPILFAAAVFSGAGFPNGIRDSPVLALPYQIFVLAQDSFDPGASAQMWGAAGVLLFLVFVASLAALPLRWRAAEESQHG